MSLKAKVLSKVGRGVLYTKKYAPEILIGCGITGFIGTTILASKATLRLDAIMTEHEEGMEKVDECLEEGQTPNGLSYDESHAKKDTIIFYRNTVFAIAKSYAPAVTLGAVSVGCFLGAHRIMKVRNVGLLMWGKGLETQFNAYRKRVISEHGEQTDFDYKNGIKRTTVKVKELDEETGKIKTVKKEVEEFIDGGVSDYVTIFNSQTSGMHTNVPGGNQRFIGYARDTAQRRLDTFGHVFLNDVFKMLDMQETQAGASVGWFKGHGDDQIDFGIHMLNSEKVLYDSHMQGHDIVLDFNVAGPIYHLLAEKNC